jgi:hypothetical protein
LPVKPRNVCDKEFAAGEGKRGATAITEDILFKCYENVCGFVNILC